MESGGTGRINNDDKPLVRAIRLPNAKASFFTPPPGVIDNSVLVAFGEILTFVGSLIGIDYHYKARG